MDIAPINEKTGYVRWMKSQGLPIHVGHGMADLRTLAVAPYERTGGKAAFIHLHGMQGITGGYIGEIPAGEALKPERHLYEEVICILSGQGATELWDEGNKRMFEWNAWSLFAATHEHAAPFAQRLARIGALSRGHQCAARVRHLSR